MAPNDSQNENTAPAAPAAEAGLFRHGKVSYMQIPALDVRASAAFYATVFGWQIRGGSDGDGAEAMRGNAAMSGSSSGCR